MSIHFQEVQSNHFLDFLAPKLQEHGYSAIYKKKTTEIYAGNSYAIDGCATFFLKERFALVKKYEVHIYLSALHRQLACSSHAQLLILLMPPQELI